ncbi:MAG: hypothetical protein ACYCY1_15915, partial [Sulfuriferula sp.]
NSRLRVRLRLRSRFRVVCFMGSMLTQWVRVRGAKVGVLQSFLKDLSPFLAILVSMMAIGVGPILAGRMARAQSVATMREKWIYAFRDCLVDLTTELDVLHESCTEKGIVANGRYEETLKKLRTLENRVRLMINTDEPLYGNLQKSIAEAIGMLIMGISDYEKFHKLNDAVKRNAQLAVRNEWKKISP